MVEKNCSESFNGGLSPSGQRLAVVIPALNEGQNIEAVLTEVSKYGFAIVVDDGSVDDTAMRARRAGAFVISHPINKGYNSALETGIRTAIDLGYEFAVTMDADGQHNPSLLNFFEAEFKSGADLVVGVRESVQRWSEWVFGYFAGLLWGVYDPLCGMKGYRLQVLREIKNLSTYDSIGTELIIRAVKSGMKVRQVKVKTRPREGISRFGGGIRVNIRIIKALYLGIFYAKALTHQVPSHQL